MRYLFILMILLLPFIFAGQIEALQINEIYPAPASSEKEWVELYNEENIDIDLKQYALTDVKENKLEFETTVASPSSYIIAYAINVLNNTGPESVILKKGTEIISTVSYSESFTANSSYVYCPNMSGNWKMATIVTQRTSNDISCQTNSPTPVPSPTSVNTPIITQTYDAVYISEVMVNPIDDNTEWVELYNDNNFTVSLQKWNIDDIENGGSAPRQFSLDIPAKSYASLDISLSIFNNDNDQVRLMDANNILKDSINYTYSVQGKTLGKIFPTQSTICILEPSKNISNTYCFVPTPTLTPTPSHTLTPTPISPTSTPRTFIPEPTLSNVAALSPSVFDHNPKPVTKVKLSASLYEKNYVSSSSANKIIQRDVLGAHTYNTSSVNEDIPMYKIFASLNICISILTIVKIFFRIRNNPNSQ